MVLSHSRSGFPWGTSIVSFLDISARSWYQDVLEPYFNSDTGNVSQGSRAPSQPCSQVPPRNGSSLGRFYPRNSSFIRSHNKLNPVHFQKIYFYEIIFNLCNKCFSHRNTLPLSRVAQSSCSIQGSQGVTAFPPSVTPLESDEGQVSAQPTPPPRHGPRCRVQFGGRQQCRANRPCAAGGSGLAELNGPGTTPWHESFFDLIWVLFLKEHQGWRSRSVGGLIRGAVVRARPLFQCVCVWCHTWPGSCTSCFRGSFVPLRGSVLLPLRGSCLSTFQRPHAGHTSRLLALAGH